MNISIRQVITGSRAILLLLLALLTPLSLPMSLYAVEGDTREDFYSSNDIIYYDENFASLCSAGGMSLQGSDNLQRIYNFLLDKGLTNAQAAGAVGNIAHESIGAKDPFVVERNSSHPELPKSTQEPSKLPVVGGWPGGQTRQPGWGLIQWTPAGKFEAIAKEVGVKEPYDLLAQIQVIWWHMEDTTPTSRKNFNATYLKIADVEAATKYFMDNMLAPNASVANFEDRLQAARLAMKYAPLVGDLLTGGVGCAGNNAVDGDAIKTALSYAWPEYHAPNYLTMKPEYAAAVKKAQDEGKYVGGGSKPGIDCNGFVSRVMEDSGVDPLYNTTADGKNAGRNTVGSMKYLASSDKYEKYTPATAGDVTPGSIAINSAHVYMYVGKQPGFETEIASASYSARGTSWRTPMAGRERPADPRYEWYRLK